MTQATGGRGSWWAVIGLGCQVVGGMLVLSAVTIGAFAMLYALAHALVPAWAFLVTPFREPVNDPGNLLMFSGYVYFHTAAPDLVVPHGPDRVLMLVEAGFSWAWVALVGAWAVVRWHALDESWRCIDPKP